MKLEAIRKEVNRGLRPPLHDDEWRFLLGEERYREAFGAEVENDDIEAARETVKNLRRYADVRGEPRLPASDEPETPSGASSVVSVPSTPSDRAWGAIAALQAWSLPEVEGYRKRYLSRCLLRLEDVPEFMRTQSDCVETAEDILAGRTREGYNIETYPAAVRYGGVVYRGRDGGGLHRLHAVSNTIGPRYGWGVESCLRLVLCGIPPAGFGRSYGVQKVADGQGGGGMSGVFVRVPEYADGQEVVRLFRQARGMLRRGGGARFSEKTAKAVVFAVERMLRGEPLAAIARAWSGDRRAAETFRKELYRALGNVGPSLGPPAVHPRGKRRRRAPGLTA